MDEIRRPRPAAAATAADARRRTKGVHDRLEQSARSVARRLVRGAGRCGVVAYREDPDVSHDALAHGLCSTGELALALPAAALPALGLAADLVDVVAGGDAAPRPEVRVRVDQHGAHHEMRVATASVHALGRLRLLGADETAAMVLAHVLPAGVEEAAVAGAPVGLVSTERMLLHGQAGVSAYTPRELVDGGCFPLADEEWDAVEVVEQRGEEWAAGVVAAAVADGSAGWTGAARRTPGSAAHLGGRMLLADVDAAGCTWLEVGLTHTRTVFVPFAAAVRSTAELADALEGLAVASPSR